MCQLLYGVDYCVWGLISPLPMAREENTHIHTLYIRKLRLSRTGDLCQIPQFMMAPDMEAMC